LFGALVLEGENDTTRYDVILTCTVIYGTINMKNNEKQPNAKTVEPRRTDRSIGA